MDPIPLARHRKGKISSLVVAASLNSSPCALSLNSDSSLYSITQMIREARSLAVNGRQAFAFYLGVQFSLTALMLFSYCALIPQMLLGYHIMFVLYYIAPIISLSMLFTPHLPDIMTHIPAKNADHWRDVGRFIGYYFVTFATTPVFSAIALYWILIVFMDRPNFPPLNFHARNDQLVLFIQNYVLFFFTLYLSIFLS